MSVNLVLLIVLLILMMIVGGNRGLEAFFTVIFNFITLFFMLGLIAFKVDPLKVTIYGSIIISSITLFYINGFNKKTIASLFSVFIVVIVTILLTVRMGVRANIQGFGWEQTDSISAMSKYVHLNFSKLVICEIILGLLGAIIDVSISITSSMNELLKNNPSIPKRNLLNSGINIGKDIIGTMTNTLLFAYIAGFMTLIIWFHDFKYSMADIINSKVFASEVFQILTSGIGIILIIPVTAVIACWMFYTKNPFKKDKAKAQVEVEVEGQMQKLP